MLRGCSRAAPHCSVPLASAAGGGRAPARAASSRRGCAQAAFAVGDRVRYRSRGFGRGRQQSGEWHTGEVVAVVDGRPKMPKPGATRQGFFWDEVEHVAGAPPTREAAASVGREWKGVRALFKGKDAPPPPAGASGAQPAGGAGSPAQQPAAAQQGKQPATLRAKRHATRPSEREGFDWVSAVLSTGCTGLSMSLAVVLSQVLNYQVPIPAPYTPSGALLWIMGNPNPAGDYAAVEAAQHVLHMPGMVLASGCIAIYFLAKQEVTLGGVLVYDAKMKVRQLVTSGPYRWSRNPIYLAEMLFPVALCLFSDNTWLLACSMVFFVNYTFSKIPYEEGLLASKFPKEWKEYAARVRRWL